MGATTAGVGVLLFGAVALFGAPITQAAAAIPPPTATLSISSASIGSQGGVVTLRATVHHATSCNWWSTPRVAGFAGRIACQNDSVARVAHLPANKLFAQRRFVLHLTVSSPHGTARDARDVVEAAAIPPPTATLSISSASIGSQGGVVTLRATVHHATSCNWWSTPRVAGFAGRIACQNDSVARVAHLPANKLFAQRRFVLHLTVSSPHGTARDARDVVEAAAIPPPTATLSISTNTVPASGGRFTLTYSVQHASRCTLASKPPSRPPLLRGGNTIPVACNGTYTATTPANDARRWTFVFTATGADGRTASASQTLTEQASTTPATTTTTPTTTTTTTTTPAGAPSASLSISTNGLPASGGPITLTYSAQGGSSCTLASAPAFWSGNDPVTVSCGGSYQATVQPASQQTEWTFTFTATGAGGQTASSTQSLSEQSPPAAASPNWSGYVVPSSSLVTAASGQWTVPTLNCSDTPNAGESTWVGIGGFGWPTGGTSGALLQTGVDDQCVNGAQQDNAWFEKYPSQPNYSESFQGFPVSPGDLIEASVYQSSIGAWETRVDDLTTGLSGVMVTGEGWGVYTDGSGSSFSEQGSTTGLSYSGGYTAEWIVEDNVQGGSQVVLANYGTVTFSGLTASMSSWSLTSSEAVEVVQNGVVVSTPSQPSSDGFVVSYTGP